MVPASVIAPLGLPSDRMQEAVQPAAPAPAERAMLRDALSVTNLTTGQMPGWVLWSLCVALAGMVLTAELLRRLRLTRIGQGASRQMPPGAGPRAAGRRGVLPAPSASDPSASHSPVVASPVADLTAPAALLDSAGVILEANSAFLRECRRTSDAVLGRPVWEFHTRGGGMPFWMSILSEAKVTGVWEGESRSYGAGAVGNAMGIRIRRHNAGGAGASGGEHKPQFVFIAQSRTAQAQQEDIGAQGMIDKLTGLPNRRAMKLQIEAAIMQCEGDGGIAAVVTLDLDRFGDINSVLGDGFGDKVLRRAARVLTGLGGADVTVGRSGGDEFLVLMTNVVDRSVLEATVGRLLLKLGQETQINDISLRLSASAGIAVYPEDGVSHRHLMQSAGLALVAAKELGRGQYQFFGEELHRRSTDSLQLELELRRGIEAGELLMFYQPQVDMVSGNCIGAEALLRWQHPERGLILPDGFVPLALDVGLNATIDRFVLNQVCKDIASWRASGVIPPRISVNLSISGLLNADFHIELRACLEKWNIPPGQLEIEVVESMMFPKMEKALGPELQQLAALGVDLAIDDFGTGYSSLAMLKDLPVSKIKIDRRFVENITEDSQDDRIVAALVAMSNSLGLSVIAEGVETQAQRAHLLAIGCVQAQGYLFGRPMSGKDFVARFAEPAANVMAVADHVRNQTPREPV